MKKKKIIIILITAIILISLIIGIKIFESKKDSKITVNVVNVENEEIISSIITTGIVKAKSEFDIVSNLHLKILKVLVKEGDNVKKGDLLIKLDKSELDYEIKEAEINLALKRNERSDFSNEMERIQLLNEMENAKIAYAEAKRKFENAQKLFKEAVISSDELKENEVDFSTAKNNFDFSQRKVNEHNKNSQDKTKETDLEELKLSHSKEKIKDSIIKSPIDGTVTVANAKIGANADTFSPLFSISDTKNLEVEVDISEFDINDIKIGQSVKISGDAFKDKEYQGKVTYISPVASEQETSGSKETNIKIKIDILDSTELLKPGISTDVEITTAKKENALVVPYEALYRKKDGSIVVYKVENNIIKEIPVQEGIEGDLKVEVISKLLKKGDQIVVNPGEDLKSGIEVNVLDSGDNND